MTTSALLVQLLAAAPNILGLVEKLVADIAAGKGDAPVDWAPLVALGFQTSADIFKREGVPLPPPNP